MLLRTNLDERRIPLSYETVKGGLTLVPSVVRAGVAFPGLKLRRTLSAQVPPATKTYNTPSLRYCTTLLLYYYIIQL